MKSKTLYRIFFTSQGKAYEIYARKVGQGDLYGFVEVEAIVFGERSSIVVDPSEEVLKNEFNGVKRFFIPFHAINRIDEVEKEGTGKVLTLAGQHDSAGHPPAPPIPPGKNPERK